MIREQVRSTVPGLPVFLLVVVGIVGSIAMFVAADETGNDAIGVLGALVLVTSIICLIGLFALTPNEAAVITLFGKYTGTVRKDGWYWVNLNDHPVTITLTVTGFFDDMIDYSSLF